MFPKNFGRLFKHDLLCLNPYLLSLIKLLFTVVFLTTSLKVIFKVIPVWQKFLALHPYVLIFSFLNVFMVVSSEESSLWHSNFPVRLQNIKTFTCWSLVLSYWLYHWSNFLIKKVLNVSWIQMSVTSSEQMFIAHGQLVHHSRVLCFVPRCENTSFTFQFI